MNKHVLLAVKLTSLQHQQQAPCPLSGTRHTHVHLPCHNMQPSSTSAPLIVQAEQRGLHWQAPCLHCLCDCRPAHKS